MEDQLTPLEVNESDDYAMAQLPGMDDPRPMSVLDLIDPSVARADKATRDARLSECRSCDRLKAGTFCAECSCVMKFKTWLSPATCPLGYWGAAS